jgi:hypothetical protein
MADLGQVISTISRAYLPGTLVEMDEAVNMRDVLKLFANWEPAPDEQVVRDAMHALQFENLPEWGGGGEEIWYVIYRR